MKKKEEVELTPEDKGMIIGSKGSTINAIKKILRAVGLKNRERISIRIKQ